MQTMIGRSWQYAYSRLRRIIRRWLRRYFGAGKKPQPIKPTQTTENQPLTDTDCEYFFMQLLEGVEHGWRQEQVLRVFEALAERSSEQQWMVWLRGFGNKLLATPAPNRQLATRMVHLGEVGCGEFGKLAKEIGTQLLARPPLANQTEREDWDTGDPQEAQAFFHQGVQQFNMEDFQGAIASYDKALRILPDAHEIWYNRGNALFKSGRIEEAIASYNKALEYKSDKYEAWNNLGNAQFKIERFAEAIVSYDKALKIEPTYQQAWYNQGVALGHLGRLEEALAAYDKALYLEPKDHQAWFNRGLVMGNLGRLEDAIASWDKTLELKPDRYEAWYNRSVALSNLGRNEEANASWEKAQALKPN